jgi:hypothetical protein
VSIEGIPFEGMRAAVVRLISADGDVG